MTKTEISTLVELRDLREAAECTMSNAEILALANLVGLRVTPAGILVIDDWYWSTLRREWIYLPSVGLEKCAFRISATAKAWVADGCPLP